MNKYVLFVLTFFVCVGMGCSGESVKKTTYETLQNIRDQECSRQPTVECEKRERFETYEQQRAGEGNTKPVVPRK